MTDELPEQDVPLDVDLTGDNLTLNEQIEVEGICGGRPFHDLRDGGSSSFYRAVAWIELRRVNPRITLHDAGELKVRAEGG